VFNVVQIVARSDPPRPILILRECSIPGRVLLLVLLCARPATDFEVSILRCFRLYRPQIATVNSPGTWSRFRLGYISDIVGCEIRPVSLVNAMDFDEARARIFDLDEVQTAVIYFIETCFRVVEAESGGRLGEEIPKEACAEGLVEFDLSASRVRSLDEVQVAAIDDPGPLISVTSLKTRGVTPYFAYVAGLLATDVDFNHAAGIVSFYMIEAYCRCLWACAPLNLPAYAFASVVHVCVDLVE
jgi:hypothetical protein